MPNIFTPIITFVTFFSFSFQCFWAGISTPKSRAYALDALKEHALSALFPIIFIGLTVGIMFAMQAYVLANTFDIERLLPGISAHVIITEVAPIFTGLMIAMQAGGYMASEISSMKSSDEMEAMSVIGLHPLNLIVGPKQVGLVFAAPLLNILTSFAATLGTYMVSVLYYGYSSHEFISRFLLSFSFQTFIFSELKIFVFGFIIASLSVYFGYFSLGKVSKLGDTTSRAITTSVMGMFFVNYFINWLAL